ncbi:2,3-bisphosphoglycerate-independent phosphoglycerate mutase [Alphaproteobacteria bacterium]|nr:2,3-bisphosphoglycerate-independent phosphoglycerate mutase [Alphaproteobacteria bacterium]
MPKKDWKPLVLCILDGWGHTKESKHNAIALAKTPTWDRWHKSFPQALLEASGPAVGLPTGQMGNSEVGHTTLGTGRIVPQDLPRIHDAIQKKDLPKNKSLLSLIQTLKKSGKACHLMGLFSSGGVHSHKDHMIALIEILATQDIPVWLHLFLDGRDTAPQSADEEIQLLTPLLKKHPSVKIATLMGRFYAMDRDNRWDRTKQAYNSLVSGHGTQTKDPVTSIKNFYKEKITDEFIPPLVANEYKGIEKDDALLMANFRADRVRQILAALTEKTFREFSRKDVPHFSHKIGMKDYSKNLKKNMEALFPPIFLKNTLGEVLSQKGLKQLRIAETEKYAHVTFFFNGGSEEVLPGEKRALIPSPKVKTYDLKPEMSADKLTKTVIESLRKDQCDVVIMNYANTDMVGHTGKLSPTIKAVEKVDQCLSLIEEVVLEKEGCLLVTADHGNAESMENPKTHQAHTAHTTNRVPFVCVTSHPYKICRKEGSLEDIAPTILNLLNIPCPKEMTGTPLLKKEKSI